MITRSEMFRAWPSGIFPVEGAHTQGGWLCFVVAPGISTETGTSVGYVKFHYEESTEDFNQGEAAEQWLEIYPVENGIKIDEIDKDKALSGDFLPLLDPNNAPGTWTLLLHDLAAAAFGVPKLESNAAVLWLRVKNGDPGWKLWLVYDNNIEERFILPFTDLHGVEDEDNPARALVLARAFIRENLHR